MFCWAVNKICETDGIDHLHQLVPGKDLQAHRHTTASKCIALLGRGLQPWEMEMIYHPRVVLVCQVCGEFNWEKLFPCAKCRFVYTCERQHFRKDHKKWCNTFKTYSEVMGSEQTPNNLENHLQIEVIDKSSMVELMKKVAIDEPEKVQLSELLTYPLTVFHALRQIKLIGQEEVTVLFVGAETQAEVEPLVKWERYLLHMLTVVRVLRLIFLGPELRTFADELTEMCEDCRSQNKQMKCEFINGKFYHEHSVDGKVDLICALNSGMYRQCGFAGGDSWKETMVRLFTLQPAPVLVTEYTSYELKKDLEKVENLFGKLKLLVQPGLNPYASLKPGLNVISEDETPVIFKNYYSVVFKPKKVK
ncbi:hypothetical protein RUM44_009175 [Polyplax serrata]|uniref:Mitochondrial splicing suppressor 51-like C-terminal domain-containing protein n=1 Tax=Polyplax serrata TaxID=468196 RepID=A0ABR1ARY8_POLSC